MKAFLDENFLLHTATAERLYHEYARDLPIIDYHCHLPPGQIAEDSCFENLTAAWLEGDHYKWRAMRIHGVPESHCTGDKTPWEKFEKWAATVPYTLRNPLYHWTHLELQRYFGVRKILSPVSAPAIYEECSAKLRDPGYSVRNLLRRMRVKRICTTDDPADDLLGHRRLREEGFEITVLPAFRPDAAMRAEDPASFNQYLNRLEKASSISISNFEQYLSALRQRHDYFDLQGCRVSDHGLEEVYAEEFSAPEINRIFDTLRRGNPLTPIEIRKFKSALLLMFASWDAEKGWVQQFHLGAIRNNNSRMRELAGPDSGWDSIGDFPQARSLSAFLDRLDRNQQLAKTILYNVNPADNELMATMAGNFNDGSVAGKVQWGAAWWFLDQKDGMTRHLNALSNMGLLSRFIGMITDSRSFLSYPRHEYFRRLLCDLLGTEIENGELPDDPDWIGKIITDICFRNAEEYFNWGIPGGGDGSKGPVTRNS
jgi:glucuronate isomerase